MNSYNLTIIIVTYNSSKIIEECLNSFNNKLYNVFIVDNNSSDETIEVIKNKFPHINIIANSKNLGFGRANNKVLNQCSTKYALILNPDAKIRDVDIQNCINNLDNNPEIALASPKNCDRKNFDDKLMIYDNIITYTNFIIGGVMFINIENIKKIGFFDEKYFMFCEDSDLSNRSIKFGFKNAIFNNALSIHIGGSSSIKNYKTNYLRFWHLGWSKTTYKKNRKNIFNFIRSSIRIFFHYFLLGILYLLIFNIEKSIKKFAFAFGSFSSLIGLKAFDKNDNPRG
jgi:GT2 family glycosyltransferase